MSFTEFSYQLMQGYDFYWLWKNRGGILQLGGSDQWGNITTGTELIRRMDGGEAFALTCPLIRKADGTKFGKTEKGNVWLDAERTSPYEFYQFWMNVSDEDAERYIKIFTMLDRETIQSAIAAHREDPGRRELQKLLAKEITIMVHGEKAYENAVAASKMLFRGNSEDLKKLDERTFRAVFGDVPSFDLPKAELPCNILDLLAVKTDIMPSKGEARKMVAGNGISINKDKFTDPNGSVTASDIVNGHYILAQKGKKNYYVINIK
jgi:tyrosyl-tRNA synthetase